MPEWIVSLLGDARSAAWALAALAALLVALLALCAALALGVQRLKRDSQQAALRGASLEGRLTELARSAEAVRQSVETQLAASRMEINEMGDGLQGTIEGFREEASRQLEGMRATVASGVRDSVSAGIDASFATVSRQLAEVGEGLGKMQSLAEEVGGLKRVLGNVRQRGLFGETQLRAILSDILEPGQYSENVVTRSQGRDPVEFVLNLPGSGDGPVWLPIDSKFLLEDYQRLLDAEETGDRKAVDACRKALARAVLGQAEKIRAKYIEPPRTTDFAVMFLACEGLYAEVLRIPGLAERARAEHRVVVAGPTTVTALIDSLRVGFQTLAVERNAHRAWEAVASARHELERFGEATERLRKNLASASGALDSLEARRVAALRTLSALADLAEDAASR